MRKIFEGKVYNTETAEEVGYYENGRSKSDFNYYAASLYRTKKGRFFLQGVALHPNSWDSNSSSLQKFLEVLDIDQAKSWVETYLDADEYENIFEVEEA